MVRMRNLILGLLVLLAVIVVLNVLTNEKTIETQPAETATNRKDAARVKFLQLLARQGLKQLQASNAFSLLEIDSMDEIYEKGFLRKWGPCALPKTNNKLKAILLGGSSSARPADNCFGTAAKDPREGRFSDILQYKLRQQGWNATIHNMAQGSTTSVWNGMMLDQLVEEEDVDLLIWEHAINDHAPSSAGTPAQMLQFWFSRVQHYYQGRRPPPILIVYLWKFNIGLQEPAYFLEHGVGYRGPEFQKSLRVIDDFIAEGLQVQVLNVADLISPGVFGSFRDEILDDRHHPGCVGSHLIADLLQYAIYSRLDLNGNQACEAPPQAMVLDDRTISASSLLDLLMNPKTIIGAFSQWEPTRNNSLPSLSIAPESLQQASIHRFNIFPDAVLPGRDDRKFGYRIPLCTAETTKLELVVETSSWQWLLVVFAGRGIGLSINDGPKIPLLGKGAQVSGFPDSVNIPRGSHDWIDLTIHNKMSSSQTKLSFCDDSTVQQRTNSRGKVQHGWIHLLVGVREAS